MIFLEEFECAMSVVLTGIEFFHAGNNSLRNEKNRSFFNDKHVREFLLPTHTTHNRSLVRQFIEAPRLGGSERRCKLRKRRIDDT
jgi:hypothetical protein